MPSLRSRSVIHRGHLLYARRDRQGVAQLVSHRDGALQVNAAGVIEYCGDYSDLPPSEPRLDLVQHPADHLILPGFVDTHVHFPQIDMIGSHGEDLLGWLDRYTFPEEVKFEDRSYAERAAVRFVDALLQAGTTSAAIFSSSHYEATDALFAECERRGVRAIIGQVSMDRHGPEPLLTKDLARHEAEFFRLKQRWHGKHGRLAVAVTPRFAPSCTDDLLRLNQRMATAAPDAFIQTHFAESPAELTWVQKLYPKSKDYLGVYEDFELLTPRTIFAHAIHVSVDERRRLKAAGARVSHCPSSNMFLGSGIMPWHDHQAEGVIFGLGSDVGAGTALSHWRTMGDAYKSQRLAGRSVSPAELFMRATNDAGQSITSTTKPQGFSVGAVADFQVVDPTTSGLLRERIHHRPSAEELLFALVWNWESPMTKAIYVNGQRVYSERE